MKRYKNKDANKTYAEGGFLIWNIDDDTTFTGYPTEAQLAEWGFEEITVPVPTPAQVRMRQIQAELASIDYLTSKYVDGEDMSEYGDWQSKRKALREEYRELEAQA